MSEKSQSSTRVVRTNSVGWMVNALSVNVNALMKKALEPLDLTISQFSILMVLLEADGLSQSAIGKKVTIPGYSMTRNLDVLEARGLIERQADKNSRRSFCIVLTAEAHKLAPQLFNTVEEVNNHFLSGMEEEKVDQLKSLLMALIAGKNK